MPDIRIVNCHVHLFTSEHVPVNYPHWLLRPFKRFPGLLILLAWLLAFLGLDGLADRVRRLRQFQKQAQAESQREVLRDVRRHYPSNTRFVVLPMDLSHIGHHPPKVPLRDQHDELAQLCRDADLGEAVIPFATIDPRADPEARELWRAVNDLGFRGVKLYPRLGFAPDDPRLMRHLYPQAARRGLPVMAHCSRGGVQGRGLDDFIADRYTDPMTFGPVMLAHPDLRLCLAHFGGPRDWAAYADPSRRSPYRREHLHNWQVAIRRMIGSGDWPGLWTDISYTLFEFDENIPFLRLFLMDESEAGDRLRQRVLFGSDFYMTRQERLSEKAVCFRLRNALGEEVFRQIAEENPRVWLGEAQDRPL